MSSRVMVLGSSSIIASSGYKVRRAGDVDAETVERAIDGLQEPVPGQSAFLPLSVSCRAHFREEDNLVPRRWAGLQPRADDRLGLAAAVARHPDGIDIGGVDGIE